jgi:hypothetical protein
MRRLLPIARNEVFHHILPFFVSNRYKTVSQAPDACMARISVRFNTTSSARQHQAADDGTGQSLSNFCHGKDPGAACASIQGIERLIIR